MEQVAGVGNDKQGMYKLKRDSRTGLPYGAPVWSSRGGGLDKLGADEDGNKRTDCLIEMLGSGGWGAQRPS